MNDITKKCFSDLYNNGYPNLVDTLLYTYEMVILNVTIKLRRQGSPRS